MTEASWDPWRTAKSWTLVDASYLCCGKRPVSDNEVRQTKTAHGADIECMARRLAAEVPSEWLGRGRNRVRIFQRAAVEAWAKQNGFRFPWEASATAPPHPAGWPWGEYETELLRHLAAAANRFWRNYDPGNPTTASTNEEVQDWLAKEHGVPLRTAEVMATILRADSLPAGRRKK